MITKEELFQQQALRDMARIAKRKEIQAQMNSPKQKLFFEKMGIRLKVNFFKEEKLPEEEQD